MPTEHSNSSSRHIEKALKLGSSVLFPESIKGQRIRNLIMGVVVGKMAWDSLKPVTPEEKDLAADTKAPFGRIQPETANYSKSLNNQDLLDLGIDPENDENYIIQEGTFRSPEEAAKAVKNKKNTVLRGIFVQNSIDPDKVTAENFKFKMKDGVASGVPLTDLADFQRELGLAPSCGLVNLRNGGQIKIGMRTDASYVNYTATVYDDPTAKLQRERYNNRAAISEKSEWVVYTEPKKFAMALNDMFLASLPKYSALTLNTKCANPLQCPPEATPTVTPTKTVTASPTSTATLQPGETPEATSTTQPTTVPQTPVATETQGIPAPTDTPEATASAIPTHTPGEGTPTVIPPSPTAHNTTVPQTPIATETQGIPAPTDTPVATATEVPTKTPGPGTPTLPPATATEVRATATSVPPSPTAHNTTVPQTPIATETQGIPAPTDTPAPRATDIPTKTPSQSTPITGGATPRPTIAPGSRSSGILGEHKIGDLIYKVSTASMKNKFTRVGNIEFINGQWKARMSKVA